MTVWALVLFLIAGYGGGVVTIETRTEASCLSSLEQARKMRSFQDGACISHDAVR